MLQKKNSYKSFLFEMLAVFIGITASFWLDDYRTELEEQKLSKNYSEEFLGDFRKDREQLKDLLVARNDQLKSSKSLLETIEMKKYDLDSFYYNYYIIFPFNRFVPNSNTITEVMNSSHLRLISDPVLKSQILDIRSKYDQLRLAEEHVYHDRSSYLYMDLTLDHIDLKGWELFVNNLSFAQSEDAEIYRRDADYFREDRYFKSFLNLYNFNMHYIIPLIEDLISQCDAIIELIESNQDL